MDKKYFVISDIHGHYDEMVSALEKNGYDSNNLAHHLVVIGDLFDRGTQSKEVLEYLYPLSIEGKATILLGNHEVFLIEYLQGNILRAIFNIKHNGTMKTLVSLTGKDTISTQELELIKTEIIDRYPYLLSWLESLPLYLEIGNYIFVHGGIDGTNENWKESSKRDFIWHRQNSLNPVKGKIMVVGHNRTATIRYPKENYKTLFLHKPEAFEILYEQEKIFIDSYVEISKFINVLILEI